MYSSNEKHHYTFLLDILMIIDAVIFICDRFPLYQSILMPSEVLLMKTMTCNDLGVTIVVITRMIILNIVYHGTVTMIAFLYFQSINDPSEWAE